MMNNQVPNVYATSKIIIKATPDKVWKILAEDFGEISKWASGVNASEGFGESIQGSSCSERACEISATGFSDTKERITVFDKESHTLQYTLFHGLPGFVKDAFNTWELSPTNKSTTMITATTEMRATGIMGRLMKGFMTRSTQKVLDAMCEELKFYIENGKPHPRKQQAIEKYNRKKK